MNIFGNDYLSITCGRGVAPYLRREVESLGYEVFYEHERGVEIKARYDDVPRLNLSLRTALHVLYPLKKFSCLSPQDLYREVGTVPWEEIIAPQEYLSIVAVTETRHVNNSMFVGQKVKDAIVDRIAAKCGTRPNSGPNKDNVVVKIFWNQDDCWLYLDTSGNKLSDRGYRKVPGPAPLQESLAAAILLAAGYDGTQPLINPMCGSGTLAIEAALIALHRAPGLLRENFGFMHIRNFLSDKWQNLRLSMKSQAIGKIRIPIIASDINPGIIEIARKNARIAGVENFIQFHVCDFAQTPLPPKSGLIVINPEYGIRLGEEAKLEPVYEAIGDFFKQKCAGHKGYIFTGNMNLAKRIGLRTSRKIPFFNAQIECRLMEYELYEGTKKST